MAKFIDPSSFRCNCGYQADFCENTVNEMCALSLKRKKRQYLGADDDKHTIAFEKGKPVGIFCPKQKSDTMIALKEC